MAIDLFCGLGGWTEGLLAEGYDVTGYDIGGPQHEAAGIKQGGSWWHDNKSASRRHSSRSPARKAAAAKIAKIPFALSSWIARTYKPAEIAA